MKYSKNIILKNGTVCLIKSASGTDANDVYENFILTHSESDFLLTYPDEFKLTLEQEREFLIKKEENPREAELCAVVGNRIVGTAGIDAIGKCEKIKDRMSFGVSIEKAYCGMGIGKALTEACIECAKAAGYVQLELDVAASNTAAVNLYKSVGFTEYGRNPLGFKSRVSGWQEVILMRKELI